MNRKSLGIGCIYSSALLGAGFATGLELFTYFVSYGLNGFLGLGICCILFAWIGYKTLKICIDKKICDYSEFIDLVSGRFLGAGFKILSFLFLNVMFSAMLAGFGELANCVCGLKPFVGSLILGVLCFFMLMGGTDLLSDISTLLCPVLILGCVIIGAFLAYESIATFSVKTGIADNFITSAIVYASYNTITSVSLLAEVSNTIHKKKEAVFSGFICGLFLLMAGAVMALPLYLNPEVGNSSLPVLQLINNAVLYKLYICVLGMAVITTAFGNGFCIAKFFKKHLCVNNKIACFLTLCIGLMLSKMGFNTIVNNVYYIFGVIGLGQLICILLYKG